MTSELKNTNIIWNRDQRLVRNAFIKLALPNVASKILVLVIVFINTVIASRFIGTGAVAAVALLTPLFLFANVLHALLASGLMGIVTRYKSCGDNDKAARAFGAITLNTLFWYILIYGLLFIFRVQFIEFFTHDEQLIADAMDYLIPYVLFQPILEVGLCMERGFRTDGRAEFFAASGVISIALNIILSLLFVLCFNGGVMSISIASCVSLLVGYAWSFSHFFSKKCTIKPDFRVISNFKEFRGYLREEVGVGLAFAVDDSMYAIVGFVLNKMLIYSGGAAAITAYGILVSVCSLFETLGMTVKYSFYQLCELFYSDHDIVGTKVVFRSALKTELLQGLVFIGISLSFPNLIGNLYGVSSQAVFNLLPIFFAFGSVASVFSTLSNIYSALYIATKHNDKANSLNIWNNVGLVAGVLVGGLLFGIKGLIISKALSACILFCIETYRVKYSGLIFDEASKVDIAAYSYILNKDAIMNIGEQIFMLFDSHENLASNKTKAAIIAEECNYQLLYYNKGNDKVLVDFRVSLLEECFCLTIIDNGAIFDPLSHMQKADSPENISQSEKILMGFSSKTSYSRVLDLNISHLFYDMKE